MPTLEKVTCKCSRKYPTNFKECPKCRAPHPDIVARKEERARQKKEASFARDVANSENKKKGSTISCKDCSGVVSKKAKTCPHCGAPVPKQIGTAGWVLAGLFFIGIIGGIGGTKNAPSTYKEPWKPPPACAGVDLSVFYETLIDRRATDGREVYVKRAWYAMTLRQKENVAQALALCDSEKGVAHIYDAHTGRELGEFMRGWGYTNHEN